jgi:four helix bundle protein
MNYQEWEQMVPDEIKGDSLWKVEAYRLGLLVGDIGWTDTQKLVAGPQTRSLADQLYRALGSISANLAEGYSRVSGRDRARFYEYALGSARESRDWYYKARHILGESVTLHRLSLLTQIIRLLLTMIPQQRARTLRESQPTYLLNTSGTPADQTPEPISLQTLLDEIPMPQNHHASRFTHHESSL